jgi:crossover junction endodeoxyribonuclease RusA
MIEIILPLPPSANRIWRNFGGRMVKSSEYRVWKDTAAASIAHQMGGQPPLMWFTAAMVMPPTRRDLDNSIKPAMDALQAGGAVEDDKRLRALVISVDDNRRGNDTVLIQLRPASEPEKPAKKGRKKC